MKNTNLRTVSGRRHKAVIPAVLVLVLGLVVLTAAGCGKKTRSEGYTISKDTLSVVLQGNPTTGYSWGCQISDENVIAFDSDIYETAAVGDSVTGAGGFDTLTFRTVGEGTAEITLTYGRQWEGGETQRVETIAVVVDADRKITAVTALTLTELAS